MPKLEEVNAAWEKSPFTVAMGIRVTHAGEGMAVCEMPLTPQHRNLLGTPHGGAIFTLADHCASVAANLEAAESAVVTQTANIHYLSVAKGTKLIATARRLKHGRSTTLYRVEITDELGTLVAVSDQCGFRVDRKGLTLSPQSDKITENM